MGFKIPKRTLRIIFDDPDLTGLEVSASKDTTMDMIVELESLQEATQGEARDAGAVAKLMDFAAEHIFTGWNVEDDDGQAVDLTGAALRRIPIDIVNKALTQYGEFMRGKNDTPLAPPSPSGGTGGASESHGS